MEPERFNRIDRWLTRSLRYGSRILLSLDELQRRASNQHYEELEFLYVASSAMKEIRHGATVCRYVVDTNETGVFIRLDNESESGHVDAWSGQ